MRHKKKILATIIVILIAALGMLLFVTYNVNGPDRTILNLLREIPLKAQKYTLAGEGESWRVQCARYDGIILENGKKRLLQELTLNLDYKGSPESVTKNMPVTFSMEADSLFSAHLRSVTGADTLVSNGAYRTIWYSSAGYADEAPADRLPLKDKDLTIAITMNGATETVLLREADPVGLAE